MMVDEITLRNGVDEMVIKSSRRNGNRRNGMLPSEGI